MKMASNFFKSNNEMTENQDQRIEVIYKVRLFKLICLKTEEDHLKLP
jgi:hypothetical protein